MTEVKQRSFALQQTQDNVMDETSTIQALVNVAWLKISPSWPLKNLIAVNPISGFEDLPFEEALKETKAYFRQKHLPEKMCEVNRQSIKWLQTFFDQGQSTIQMPHRHKGFLSSILSLLPFDASLNLKLAGTLDWLNRVSQDADSLISECLSYLNIDTKAREQFLSLMLTTLPGWASYIQYRTSWADSIDAQSSYTVTQQGYLAFRLVLTCLVWPDAKNLLAWHLDALDRSDVTDICNTIADNEGKATSELLTNIKFKLPAEDDSRPSAQLVFCIDVRSEPFRRAIESRGHYKTFGFAGFFGLPVSIEDQITKECHHSCPVLLKPAHNIVEKPNGAYASNVKGHQRFISIKKYYQSVKYTFTTPFSLVETIGVASGLWMAIKNLAPVTAKRIKTNVIRLFKRNGERVPEINTIPFEQQVGYAASALKMMGLSTKFAQLVLLCGHGSSTENNAYATSLDCGACGGRHGAPNARILAAILNTSAVKEALLKENIVIPNDSYFLAAEHNTTTDDVKIFDHNAPLSVKTKANILKQDLVLAQEQNTQWRSSIMGGSVDNNRAKRSILRRSKDWSEIRPEWGLAKNSVFIIGPRSITENIDLEGRAFLHSYNWEQDAEYESLTTIMTAPVVVAQWINAQYLFSTLDNVAYGSGSKVTQNITSKMGVMQGNASDLMHGLPLQSVYKTDTEPYHILSRLTVIIYAPVNYIDAIIGEHSSLQKLFGNGWLNLICFDPKQQQKLRLQRNFTWEKID